MTKRQDKIGVPYRGTARVTTFAFKPGPPKPARTVTVKELRKIVRDGAKLVSYKNISLQPLVWKVYVGEDGGENFYVGGSAAFDKFVRELGLEGG